jgi:hypothetical protein
MAEFQGKKIIFLVGGPGSGKVIFELIIMVFIQIYK